MAAARSAASSARHWQHCPDQERHRHRGVHRRQYLHQWDHDQRRHAADRQRRQQGTPGNGGISIASNAALVFDRSDTALVVPGAISGAGSMVQSGGLVASNGSRYPGDNDHQRRHTANRQRRRRRLARAGPSWTTARWRIISTARRRRRNASRHYLGNRQSQCHSRGKSVSTGISASREARVTPSINTSGGPVLRDRCDTSDSTLTASAINLSRRYRRQQPTSQWRLGAEHQCRQRPHQPELSLRRQWHILWPRQPLPPMPAPGRSM